MSKKLTTKSIVAVLLIFTMFHIPACASSSKENKPYTVIFKDYDGSVLKTWKSDSGQELIMPETPDRKGYEFSGWDKNIDDIQSDTTVIAQYSAVKNQLYFDYATKDEAFVVTLSLCGDVQVCGFEATLLYRTEDLVLEDICVVKDTPCEVNFLEQSDGRIKIFFFHDQIENIIQPFDILVMNFKEENKSETIEFVLDITVFVDKDFSPVTFNIANNMYQK